MANNNGKSSLFIGDLAIFCTERDVEETFSPYGEIQEIKIMRSEETSRNLSYGFIKYSSAQAAKRAMGELNGVILCGRPLRIRWATYKSKVGSKEPKQDALETSPVHVSFISYQIDKLVTEESLRDLFSKYGLVVDASIKKSMIDTDVRRQSGYGFVHYSITREGINAALTAARTLDDITVESVNYKCSLSHNLNKYLTGELTMPEDPLPPAGHAALPAQQQQQQQQQYLGNNGYQDDLGLVDSDQFFHSPPQAQQQQMYNVVPPGGLSMYSRPPNGSTQGMYQQQQQAQGPPAQYANQQQQQAGAALYQQPKYVSQVPQAARNRPPPGPPQPQGQAQVNARPRSMDGYADLQNQLQQQQQHQQHQQQSLYDMPQQQSHQQQQYGANRFENQQLDRYKQIPPQGQGQYGHLAGQQHQQASHYANQTYGLEQQQDRDPHQHLQGVMARGNLAQQRASASQSNLAAIGGAYQPNQNQNQLHNQGQGQGQMQGLNRPSQFSSGSATVTALGRPHAAAQVQVRGLVGSGAGPGVYAMHSSGPQTRVVSTPNILAANGVNGVNGVNGSPVRWSTGNFNAAPPPPAPVQPPVVAMQMRAPVQPALNKSIAPPKPPKTHLQNQHLNQLNQLNQQQGQVQYAQPVNYSNNNYQTQQPQQGYGAYGSEFQQQNNYGANDLNTGFANLNLQQHQLQNQQIQQQQMQLQQQQQQQQQQSQFPANLFPITNALYSNNSMLQNVLSLNMSPANPLPSFMPSPVQSYLNFGSPVTLSPYVAATMSPVMSPSSFMPRDLLFTPATGYYPSPVVQDGQFSPVMFAAGPVLNNGNGNGNGSGNYIDLNPRHYKTAHSSRARAAKTSLGISPIISTQHRDVPVPPTAPEPPAGVPAAAGVAATATVSAAESADTAAAPGTSETVTAPSETAVGTTSSSAPALEGASSFFGSAEVDGSPLERPSQSDATTELDSSESATFETLGTSTSTNETVVGAPPGLPSSPAQNGGGEGFSKAQGLAPRRLKLTKGLANIPLV